MVKHNGATSQPFQPPSMGGLRRRRRLLIGSAFAIFALFLIITVFNAGAYVTFGGTEEETNYQLRNQYSHDGEKKIEIREDGKTVGDPKPPIDLAFTSKPSNMEASDKLLTGLEGQAAEPTDRRRPRRPPKIRHITVQTGETPPWCRMILSFFLSNPVANKIVTGGQEGDLLLESREATLRSKKISGVSIKVGYSQDDGSLLKNEKNIGEMDGTADEKITEKKQQLTIHNIGWGRKYAHSARPAWILEWLSVFPQSNELDDDDIIMFADGGDTLYTGVDSDTIASEFDKTAPRRSEVDIDGRLIVQQISSNELRNSLLRSRRRGRSPSLPAFLFNAEANCYHQQTFGGSWGPKKGRCLSAYRRHYNRLNRKQHFSMLMLKRAKEVEVESVEKGENQRGRQQQGDASSLLAHLLPENIRHLSSCGSGSTAIGDSFSETKFKYLNAGAWIGRVWAVKKVFTAVKSIIDANNHLWCDQSVIGGVLLKGQFSEWVMGIDTQNRFFLPIYHLDERRDFCPSNYREYNGNDNDDDPTRMDDDSSASRESNIGHQSGMRRIGSRGEKSNSAGERSPLRLAEQRDEDLPLPLPLPQPTQQNALLSDQRQRKRRKKPRLLTMCHSNQTPAVLHFNGKSEKMARFLTRRTTWWQEYNLQDLKNRGARDAQLHVADIDLRQLRAQNLENRVGGEQEQRVPADIKGNDKSVIDWVSGSAIVLAGKRGEPKQTEVKDKCPALVMPP